MEASALKGWELENNVKLVDPNRDSLYNFNSNSQKILRAAKPWRSDPNHFKTVRISAVALIKMVMHARSGGNIEVMGLMQGFVEDGALVVTDAFRLPVEGTETRVNAQEEANEYMVNFPDLARDQGARMENILGWYHSHPGYGCWLSGIDVATQHNWQTFEDPFVAVVIDPHRTISAGKVEIGAFRTYPENYKPTGVAGSDGYQTVPMAKAEDFGAHADRYYSLEVETFKSTLESQLLDLLWNKYWVQTLSANPLVTNRDYGTRQLLDLGSKVRELTKDLQRKTRAHPQIDSLFSGGSTSLSAVNQNLDKLARDSKQIAAKEETGLMAVQVKAKIFNGLGGDF
ncbi:COP9 signalosome complex subunit 5 [Cryphonectria parasitica EP155]|uniref:COP9 signalosome complex subunit 5 n=1 Tax=Cryphonectria parasitica (strain ATCC 38755 / EP155) TaxID=660469 RepID=A0A9P4YCD5_CRYP1|nr:COP9 signalosome complex subunit 5 [Cryphonectria parasitica EP155]KAF3770292.1 COP9 signalosome complex subunit 5 [Cryphonectria parasitica EP155]